jgi:hypothetical protein
MNRQVAKNGHAEPPPGPREARPEDRLRTRRRGGTHAACAVVRESATPYNLVMAGPLSRPPMKTVAGMVPRDAFIAVYMMSNRKHGTLYIGVTGNLVRRAGSIAKARSKGSRRSTA